MDNFILLDGWSLTAALGIIIFMCLCGISLGFITMYQERENRRLKKENRRLASELGSISRQLTIANSTLRFMKNRAQELEEEISVRDEAIAESLKGSVNNV